MTKKKAFNGKHREARVEKFKGVQKRKIAKRKSVKKNGRMYK